MRQKMFLLILALISSACASKHLAKEERTPSSSDYANLYSVFEAMRVKPFVCQSQKSRDITVRKVASDLATYYDNNFDKPVKVASVTEVDNELMRLVTNGNRGGNTYIPIAYMGDHFTVEVRNNSKGWPNSYMQCQFQ